MDLQAIRGAAEGIAREAGAVLMQHFGGAHREQTKKNFTDIVTEGDTASEALIVAALTAQFPDHHIVGEEGGGMGAPAETAEFFWYVDPLDGTSNYANNIPFFAVSIALADRAMRPLVGVVFDPFSDELYSAARGFGTTLNGSPVTVSETDTLADAMLVSGFPYDAYKNPDNNLAEWAAFMMRTRGLRRLGSAALDLAYVAAGRFEGYWEQGLNPWDMQAGLLLVLEAGGAASDYSGAGDSALLYEGRQVVASNGRLHADMVAVIGEARAALAASAG